MILLKKFFHYFASLKFAVIIITFLAGTLAVATVMESYFDIKTGRYWVYQTAWFYGLLFLLGVSIFCVALSRYPWKKHHGPFLMAHVGILTLLYGSFITYIKGVDGLLILEESKSSSRVEFDTNVLYLSKVNPQDLLMLEIPWRPPHVKFSPIEVPKYGVTVSKWITHAEPDVRFLPLENSKQNPSAKKGGALKIKLQGGPLNINREFWLWGGDASWSSFEMGPVQFILYPTVYRSDADFGEPAKEARFEAMKAADGRLHYRMTSSRALPMKGIIETSNFQETTLQTPWMGMVLKVSDWLPEAVNVTSYIPSRTQYGERAPGSALMLQSNGNSEVTLWLGQGDRGTLTSVIGETIQAAYLPKTLQLPFGLKLERFDVQYDPGSKSPASYSSLVTVLDNEAPEDSILISMNEPLYWKGFTFYQSSYIPGEPRPTTSVLSVNQDPGRFFKYLGSLLIVIGSAWLFLRKYQKKGKN